VVFFQTALGDDLRMAAVPVETVSQQRAKAARTAWVSGVHLTWLAALGGIDPFAVPGSPESISARGAEPVDLAGSAVRPR
jgi:hypothetical protein